MKNFFLWVVLATCGMIGCVNSDEDGATVKIVNGESGCTLSEVYIYPTGSSKGDNLVAGDGIAYNSTPRAFGVDPDETYSVQVSSNTSTSNLDPVANCSVTLSAGETRTLTYSYGGGPSLFWGQLSGCN